MNRQPGLVVSESIELDTDVYEPQNQIFILSEIMSIAAQITSRLSLELGALFDGALVNLSLRF